MAPRDAGSQRRRSAERRAPAQDRRELQSWLPRIPADVPDLHARRRSRHKALSRRRRENRPRYHGAVRQLGHAINLFLIAGYCRLIPVLASFRDVLGVQLDAWGFNYAGYREFCSRARAYFRPRTENDGTELPPLSLGGSAPRRH